MTEPSRPEAPCPVCSTPGTGRFCASCGSPLGSSTCTECNTPLEKGSRFCHACGKRAGKGTPGSATRPASPSTAGSKSLRWTAVIIGVVAVLAYFAGRAVRPVDPATGMQIQVPLGGAVMEGEGAVVRAPDISGLSPEESADRLYNRVMLLASQGKTDSVLFFAPMAIEAYRMMSPLDLDQRYDVGRIAEVAGALPLAQAQADTILARNPTHLLGLVLAARVATVANDAAAKKRYASRILAASEAESGKKLPEYERHADDIASAVADARRSAGAGGN